MLKKFLLLVTALLLSACSASIEQPGVTETPTPLPFYTATLPPTPTRQVSPTPAPSLPPPTPAPVSGVTSTQVNVRSGPQTGLESLGILQAGSPVEVLGRDESGQWLAINFPQSPAGLGWVSAQFVEIQVEVSSLNVLQSAPQPEATLIPPIVGPEATATPQKRTARTTSQINLRSGPASTFESLGLLDANTTVTLTGRNLINTWVQIEYPPGSSERAWVAVAYLTYEGFLDSLPAFDNQGQPILTVTPSGPDSELATRLPGGYQPATEDLDSAENPAVRLSFSPSGTRRIIYASDVSSPTGDNADWIEFTLVTPQNNQASILYFELDCTGNGAITAELRQNGLLVSEFPGLLCGQYGVPFKALSGVPYLLRLKADGSASEIRYVDYYLYISTTP